MWQPVPQEVTKIWQVKFVTSEFTWRKLNSQLWLVVFLIPLRYRVIQCFIGKLLVIVTKSQQGLDVAALLASICKEFLKCTNLLLKKGFVDSRTHTTKKYLVTKPYFTMEYEHKDYLGLCPFMSTFDTSAYVIQLHIVFSSCSWWL